MDDTLKSSPLLRAGGLEQRIALLMGARLTMAFVSLGVALTLDATLRDLPDRQQQGLYGTVAFAFLATALFGAMVPRIRRLQRFAVISIAADILIVSSLVALSGGADSVYGFLYLLVACYSALLFDRVGAYLTAGIGSIAYGVVLMLGRTDWMGWTQIGEPIALPALMAAWALHAGSIGLVGALSSFLAVELRSTGEALRSRTNQLESLSNLHQRTVESLMSGLLTTDHVGFVSSFNPEAERITGIRASEAIGKPIASILPGFEPHHIGVDGAAADPARLPIRQRFVQRGPSGGEIHLGVSASILRDAAGASIGQVVIFQDLTDVVKMESKLRRSERLAAVGALSASIAHEIRNPLAAISGSIQVLHTAKQRGGAIGIDESGRLMEIVLRETDRLNQLIGDFLQYARPGPLRPEPCDLGVLVSEVRQLLEGLAAPGIRIECQVEPDLQLVADPAQIRQVLWNLSLNGIQAMPDGGRLRIQLRRTRAPITGPSQRDTGEWVEITVEDEGNGMATEVIEQAFQPFFTTKSGGSGLGLATVYRIVEEHGGEISIESHVGRGTKVTLMFPGGRGGS